MGGFCASRVHCVACAMIESALVHDTDEVKHGKGNYCHSSQAGQFC